MDPPSADETDERLLLDDRLQRTMRAVKRIDLMTCLISLAALVVAYLLIMTLVDHWLVDLGFLARVVGLAVLAGATGLYLTVRILPLLLHRINPLYAARTIEDHEPELKNGLLNYLLARLHPSQRPHAAILAGMEQQAAQGVSGIPLQTVVDRSQLVRMGYVLAALVLAALVYQLFSPKDPVASVARLVTPWRDIPRPSRVTIDQVAPGDAEVFRGRQVELTAHVFGHRSHDAVTAVYRTEG